MFHTINDAKRCAFWRLLRYLHESGLATAPTSDTSTATVFLPVSGPLAIGLNQPVRRRSAPVTLAASADFALPVGTPPNAVAAGSGLVSLGRRVRAGIGVNQRFALLLPTMH
jgi:sodium-dependent dicarboxylate transporter 2/3/5